jgi:hypothetical protein
MDYATCRLLLMAAEREACRLVAPEGAAFGSGFGVSVGLWVVPRSDRAGAARTANGAEPRDFEGSLANNGGDRTGWLGRRDSNLCISKSDLLNFIPPQRVLGVDRARL